MDTVIYFIVNSESASKANFKNISINDNEQLKSEKNILSVSGEKLAEALSKNIELKAIDALYSSSYVRALSTAKYFSLENNISINIDDRLNERKIGQLSNMDWQEFIKLQFSDFDFKLSGGESLNQAKKRMADAVKNILMFESGNRVVVVSHSTAVTCLLSLWCKVGKNYDDQLILTYNDDSIIDGHYTHPMVFKVTFDGMNVTNVEYLNIVE